MRGATRGIARELREREAIGIAAGICRNRGCCGNYGGGGDNGSIAVDDAPGVFHADGYNL